MSSKVDWATIQDIIYPVGSIIQSDRAITTSNLKGTWTLLNQEAELKDVELYRYWSDASKTSFSYTFGEITWADDIEIDIQFESTASGGVGFKINDAGGYRDSIRRNSTTITGTQANDGWIAYVNVDSDSSMQGILRCISAPENTVNYRRIQFDIGGNTHARHHFSSLNSSAKLKSFQIVAESGANLRRLFVLIRARRRMGTIYRYKRTA